VKQAVVVGYWEMLLGSDPDELQAWIDAEFAKIRVPCLGVFGRPVTDPERERFGWLPDVQLEEWVGDGHFEHLVDHRFARPTGSVRRLLHCYRLRRDHRVKRVVGP
jgi:hypothetical protein